jgi:PAS domain S-box-containing protein
MGQGDILGIGLLLVALGGIFWLATRFLLRTVPGLQQPVQTPPIPVPPQGQVEQADCVLLIQPGGRVLQINAAGRSLFGLAEGEPPNLERLARRLRPSEKFLELCAIEGHTHLVLDGRSMAISSYRITLPGQAASPTLQGVTPTLQGVMLVAVQPADPDSELATGPAQVSGSNFQWVSEFTQVIGSSLDLDATLRSIRESLERVIPADLVEITLWESETEQLIPYRFLGAVGADQTLETPVERYRLGEGIAGQIAKSCKALLVADMAHRPDLRLVGGRGADTLQSLAGVPLLVHGELVGVLVAGMLTRDALTPEDLNLIQMVAGPAAAALSNAMRFRNEQRRAVELAGLAQLAQGFSSAREPKTLFARLVQSILPLVNVDILGFLIYNETTRTLEGQDPIFGLPSQFVELYRVPVPTNSPAEQMLLNQDLIITEFAAEAPEWETLGLDYLARAASLRDTVLVPLASGGRMLGYLQASNHTDSTQLFTQEEIHLLTIVANQAAPVIENVTLVMQARQRAQRAEALRRIASLASSAATLDEILKFVLQELSHLLRADLGFIFLLDQSQGILRLHPSSFYGRPETSAGLSFAMPVDDPQYHFTVTGSSHALITRNINDDKSVIPFYHQLTQAWQVVSSVAVPLVVRDVGIGELWLGSLQDGTFDQGDLQVLATAAGQLAGVVEQSILSAQTDERLRLRIEQLTALTRISRELSSSRDLTALLGTVYDETLKITGVDCGTILLIEPDRPEDTAPIIRFSTGDKPGESLGESEWSALRSGETINIPDLARAGIEPPHAGVVSLLIVPVRYQARSAGLIILHGQRPDSFKPDEVEVVQSLAAQAAVALGDAYLFEEERLQEILLQNKLKLIDSIASLSQAARSNRPISEILDVVATAIRETTPFQVVVISLYESGQELLRRVVRAGLDDDAWEELRTHTQPWKSLQAVLQTEFQNGLVYYIPSSRAPEIPADVHLVTVLPEARGENRDLPDAWDADDLLMVPLLGEQNQPLGLISLDAPIDWRRPDATTYAALEALAGQANLAIEHWRQVSERDARLTRLEGDQTRLQKASDQARVQVPLFLRHDLEQTVAIQTLNRQMERVRSGLEIAEQANRQPDALAVLRLMARELLTRFDMQVALVAEKNQASIHLLDVIGSIPTQANPEALFGQRNPLRQMLQDGELQLVADLEQKNEWRNAPLLSALGAKSYIVLPLEIDENRRGGVMVIGLRQLPVFSDADHQIYAQLSRQVSLGTQNLDLLSETRRRLREMDLLLEYTRRLGLLDPRGILLTLIETVLEVLPNGDAGWVGLWVEDRVLIPQVARGYADNASMLSISYQSSEERGVDLLPLRVVHSGQPLRCDVAFAQDYSLQSEDLMRYRKATGGRLPVSTLVVPIGRGDQVLGVLVVDQFSLSNAFGVEDEALSVSLAQQSAMALENARLFVSAEARAAQLLALNQVSSALSSSLQQGELISVLLNQLRLVLPYETATLWLRRENTLNIAAANGFEDNESRLGISVAVQDSALFQEMIQTGYPVLVPDVRQDARFPSLMVPDHLSWLGIPLIAKAELIGAIALEKHEPGFYSSEHLQSASTFASQAGVALENSRLFEESIRRASELDQRTQRLVLLNRLSSELGATLDEDTILGLTCQQLLAALNANRVSTLLVGDQDNVTLKVEVPAGANPTPQILPNAPLLDRLRETQGIFNTVNIGDEPELKPLSQAYFDPHGVQSVIFVPLVTAVSLYGWLVVQTCEAYRFSSSEIELARTISNQAAVALQNARLYNETRSLTQDLERRVEERTTEVRHEHNNTQALLRIITELSSSLDLDLVMTRTLAVLNETIGSEQSLILLNDGKFYQSGIELMSKRSEDAPHKGTPEYEIARWVSRRRVPALVDNILDDNRWKLSADQPSTFRSVIAVPLILGEEVSGSLLLLHSQPANFMIEQVSLIEATARQFSIALNNAELFTLIRDQAQHLGGLLREQQIEASRSRAILESVADGVVITDSSIHIDLFNASAERILDLKRDDVLGKSLDTFAGLFGNAGQVWRDTILRWTQASEAYQSGETFAEQIDLDNGRVVAVNMAPVFYRNDFLATVSIFRDITQEVQVDRLKSEFVANVSHELRTPMTSIKGYVEIMLMGAAGELNVQQRHFLEIVKGNTERLNVLVNDLLDVSRIEAGRVVLSLQPLDLREVAAEVFNDIQRRSRQENKPMTFRLDAPQDLPRVMGDAIRIRQVLTNLVINGYNYSPQGSEVVVHMAACEGDVQVDVQDSGIGIDPKNQPRIFERFYRGEDPLVLATAGTGLGLSISKILIEMHHGRIWFRSSGVRGEGSVFSITLPLNKGEE